MFQLLGEHRPGSSDLPGGLAGPAPPRTIVELLERQARATPDAIAVTFGERDHSYAELDRAASAVARSVAARVAGAEPLVGLCIHRGFELVVCLIGILKAGAAYLPLDPGLPDARLRQVVAEAAPALVVTSAALAPTVQALGIPMLCLEEVDASGTGTPRPGNENSLAYVLYTSGSTGPPKGVEVTHGSVLNLLASCRREPGMGGGDVAFALARMSFDVSVLEILLPLSCGARLVILPESATRDPYQLAQAIAHHRATVVQAPPALWQSLVDSGWRGSAELRAWSGAEALPRRLADRLITLCGEVWNCYGPTEATVIATVQRVTLLDAGEVSIGRPIANTTLAILDPSLRPVADGEEGELCIGGAGVARGYRGRPELTAERFVAATPGSGRLYRTGDLARRGADGLLRLVGRTDAQVKVRGFRVELGEIEQSLAGHAAVATCAARVWPDAIGQNAVFAYCVRRSGEHTDEAELKTHLRARLPDYMIPQRIVFLPRLPLTPNAKVDRAALPAPLTASAGVSHDTAFTATEARMAAIWTLLLGPIPLKPDDDFFDLGGYSLLTVRLLLHLEEAFGRSLSLAELLSHSSLTRMAALIDDASGDATARRVIPIRREGDGIPLFWLDTGPLLRPALLAIGGDTPVFGLNLAPEDEQGLLAEGFDIARLASVMLAMLRELSGDRPFHLGGWCRWGTVAYEVACQLREAGHRTQLVLLDTDLPRRGLGWRAIASRLGGLLASGHVPAIPQAAPKSFSETVGRLSETYVARPYAGNVVLIQPTDRKGARPAVRCWADVIGGRLRVHDVPGDHLSMMDADHAGKLGEAIRAALRT